MPSRPIHLCRALSIIWTQACCGVLLLENYSIPCLADARQVNKFVGKCLGQGSKTCVDDAQDVVSTDTTLHCIVSE